MDSMKYPARTGWRAQEEELLFSEIEAGRARALPLKAVFERVAERTGRKPNSVRNYYYARVKEQPELAAEGVGAFVPFKPEEIRQLLRHVLTEQARGRSVRAITLAMGEGDTRAMLRYQNKYRALIKADPRLVREIMAELKAEGRDAFDPYGAPARRAGRPRGSAADAAGRAMAELERVEGLDARAFFEGLSTLAAAASRGEDRELTRQVEAQRDELESQRRRVDALLALYRQLLAVNKEFLGVNSGDMRTRELFSSIESCERALPD